MNQRKKKPRVFAMNRILMQEMIYSLEKKMENTYTLARKH